ncbi:unnamed protein product [Protopolystoma xenopodis]|uniref:Uncharacterized protein n=1 Tax=Protopolystoma xenopodis TaxID=117903 RepID=A0A3S5AX88_9PLAT|nr:unnamed protein product [Protopolystoma xenopodis]
MVRPTSFGPKKGRNEWRPSGYFRRLTAVTVPDRYILHFQSFVTTLAEATNLAHSHSDADLQLVTDASDRAGVGAIRLLIELLILLSFFGNSYQQNRDTASLAVNSVSASDKYSLREFRQMDYIPQLTCDVHQVKGAVNILAYTLFRIYIVSVVHDARVGYQAMAEVQECERSQIAARQLLRLMMTQPPSTPLAICSLLHMYIADKQGGGRLNESHGAEAMHTASETICEGDLKWNGLYFFQLVATDTKNYGWGIIVDLKKRSQGNSRSEPESNYLLSCLLSPIPKPISSRFSLPDEGIDNEKELFSSSGENGDAETDFFDDKDLSLSSSDDEKEAPSRNLPDAAETLAVPGVDPIEQYVASSQ